MKRPALIIGTLCISASLVAGLFFGLLSRTDYAAAMQDALTRSEELKREARAYSCKRTADLYSRCIVSDGGDVCGDFHTAEAEHALHFHEEPLRSCTAFVTNRGDETQKEPASSSGSLPAALDPLFFGDEEAVL